MLKQLKKLLLIVPILLISLLVWHLSRAPVNLEGGIDLMVEEIDPSQLAATGIDMVQTDGGRVLWTLEAPRAQQSLSGGPTLVSDPKLTLFRDDGSEITIRAQEGEVQDQTHPMLFRHDVVVMDHLGRKLTTQTLRFEPVKGLLATDDRFVMTSPEYRLEGVGLRAFKEVRRLDVLDQVRFDWREPQ